MMNGPPFRARMPRVGDNLAIVLHDEVRRASRTTVERNELAGLPIFLVEQTIAHMDFVILVLFPRVLVYGGPIAHGLFVGSLVILAHADRVLVLGTRPRKPRLLLDVLPVLERDAVAGECLMGSSRKRQQSEYRDQEETNSSHEGHAAALFGPTPVAAWLRSPTRA